MGGQGSLIEKAAPEKDLNTQPWIFGTWVAYLEETTQPDRRISLGKG